MPLVSLQPSEMARDVEGIRPSSFRLTPGTWEQVTQAELELLRAHPVIGPRLLAMQEESFSSALKKALDDFTEAFNKHTNVVTPPPGTPVPTSPPLDAEQGRAVHVPPPAPPAPEKKTQPKPPKRKPNAPGQPS